MKIALIAPYSLFREEYPVSEDPALDQFMKPKQREYRLYSPSDSLLQIAALTPKEHELIYMDDQFDNIDASSDVDIAAFTVTTMSANRAYLAAGEFKKRGIFVVMGGIHPTLCPDEAGKHADSIVVGDAERVWPVFLSDFRKGKAKKVYNGGVVPINKSPPPLISLLPREHFFKKQFNMEVYSLRTSVGCTRGCKFCSNWQKLGCNRLRKKTMGQISRELEQIASYSDRYFLMLTDDNPFLDLKHITHVLEYIKDMNIRWVSGADISISDHPLLLKLIKDSGCMLLCFGLESLNPDNLKWLSPWKAKFVEGYKERLKIIRDNGLNAVGSFIIGMDYDNKSTFKEYFDFFMETKMCATNMGILTPFPGTKFRDKLIADKRLDMSAPWSAYTALNLLFKHSTLSKKDIYEGLMWFHKQLTLPQVVEHMQQVIFK